MLRAGRSTRCIRSIRRTPSSAASKGQSIVDITVNAAGDVTTAAVASGPQELRASAFKAALGLKYTKGSSTTAMKIAFEYMLTGTSWGVRMIGDALPNVGPAVHGDAKRRLRREGAIRQVLTHQVPTASAAMCGRRRNSRMFRPEYPASRAGGARSGRRDHGSAHRRERQRQRYSSPQVDSVARSGRDRRGQAVAVHADADERRRRARDHDGDRQLLAARPACKCEVVLPDGNSMPWRHAFRCASQLGVRGHREISIEGVASSARPTTPRCRCLAKMARRTSAMWW